MTNIDIISKIVAETFYRAAPLIKQQMGNPL